MKKALIAAILLIICAAGCKKHVNNAKPVPIAIHEIVDCSAVQAVPVSNLRTGEKLCVAREAIVTEKNIRDAQASHSSATGEPQVLLYLDRSGGTRMSEATQRISGSRDGQLAMLIDGHVYRTYAIRGTIEDSLVINGGLTDMAAQDLADILTAGK
jgi:preprotein translocase subunit SecD